MNKRNNNCKNCNNNMIIKNNKHKKVYSYKKCLSKNYLIYNIKRTKYKCK